MSEPVQYSIRFSVEAEQNAITIAHAFVEQTGDAAGARALYHFFFDTAGVLASFPDRHRLESDESALLGYEVRHLLARRGTRAWHLAYRIENGADGPTVWILCIRDARVPMETEEAERIRDNQ